MITLKYLHRQAMLLACLILGAILSSNAQAADFSTAIAGRVFCDANCNRKIDEGIDDVLSKVTVQLYNKNGQLIATTTPEVYGGTYIFPDLVEGEKYYVKVVVPYGSEAIRAVPSQNAKSVSRTTIEVVVVKAGETYYPNDFLLECCTVGFNQCEWGYDRCGFSPIDLICNRFRELFPNGVVIGGNKTLTFTSPRAILNFLPQSGYAKTLQFSRVDPRYGCDNEFAGHVLALTLNVRISDAGITIEGYGDRVLNRGKFAGLTVRQVLALANTVLGGNTSALPAGASVRDLSCTVESINDYSGGCGSCGGGGCGGNNNGCGGGSWGGNGCGGNWGGGWGGGRWGC